jgi:hypothetical protein
MHWIKEWADSNEDRVLIKYLECQLWIGVKADM